MSAMLSAKSKASIGKAMIAFQLIFPQIARPSTSVPPGGCENSKSKKAAKISTTPEPRLGCPGLAILALPCRVGTQVHGTKKSLVRIVKTTLATAILLLTMFANAAEAEEWRIAELLSEGPSIRLIRPEDGVKIYCETRFIVVIKVKGTADSGNNMMDTIEDPAYTEFQKAERWIRKTYPDKVNKLELLNLSFGRSVNSEFPNEEAVFADMALSNGMWASSPCNTTINIKKSGKSYGSNSQ